VPSGASLAQFAPALGSHLPQSPVAPDELYSDWKDQSIFPALEIRLTPKNDKPHCSIARRHYDAVCDSG
jgi:hypothetical protein